MWGDGMKEPRAAEVYTAYNQAVSALFDLTYQERLIAVEWLVEWIDTQAPPDEETHD